MPIFKVNIKWGKEVYSGIELSTDESPIVFKAQLFALTGVQPERQKIMVKGSTIGDVDWSNCAAHLKNDMTLMMLGSVEKLPDAPVQKQQFLEDMTEAQIALALDLPVGLKNLGNTCYLNSVVQCLKACPELCAQLGKYKNSSGDMPGSLTLSLAHTFDYMEKYKQQDFAPLLLVQLLRTVFPQFSTMGEDGTPQQQDANECLTELLRVLQQKLPKVEGNAVSNNRGGNLIEQYFFGEFSVTMKNDETEEEPVTNSTESYLQLSCFISQDVKYLQTGLRQRLEEKLTKRSELLGRDAVYTKTSRISRLPAYLNVQLVRFFYKEKEKVSAKILKDIKFPLILDLFELCTLDLQKKLIPVRESFKLQEDEESQRRKAEKIKNAEGGDKAEYVKPVEEIKEELAPYSFEDDPGSSNSGYYDLIAVLTHKGRSANSGHYVGWSKNAKTGQWFMFDDDVVTAVTEEDILKLSGGGDWHTAYVLLYGPRRLKSRFLNKTSATDLAATNTNTTETLTAAAADNKPI